MKWTEFLTALFILQLGIWIILGIVFPWQGVILGGVGIAAGLCGLVKSIKDWVRLASRVAGWSYDKELRTLVPPKDAIKRLREIEGLLRGQVDELLAECIRERDDIERLTLENWQLKGALGYPVPSNIPEGEFKCGLCDARGRVQAEGR